MFEKFKALFSGKKAEPAGRTKKEPDLTQRVAKEKSLKTDLTQAVEDVNTAESIPKEAMAGSPVSDKDHASARAGQEGSDHAQIKAEKEQKHTETRQPRKRNDEGRDLYRFLNQAIKTMHIRYSEGRFDDLTHLGKVPDSLVEKYDEIVGKLPEDLQAWLSALRAMIVLREEEGALYTDIADKEGLKKEFLNMMLPFYATYAMELGQGKVRFSSLIGPDMLRLFHELTGKKFSVGFHRRYESGINAFEWEGDRYKVFDSKGKILCDAVFKDGLVESGYARLKEPDPEFEDWDIVRTGAWKEGVFQKGAVCYAYRIPVQ